MSELRYPVTIFHSEVIMNGGEAEKIEEHYTPSLEVAKVMIKDYFEHRHGELIDFVDLVNAFDLPLPLIVEACEQLEREGRIAGVNETPEKAVASSTALHSLQK